MSGGKDHISWIGEDGLTHHRQTLHLAPIPERFARIYRRRGMEVPAMCSGHLRGAAWRYRPRWRHKLYAQSHNRYWLPCVLCTKPHGGHEISDSIPDPTAGPRTWTSICPACTAKRNGGRA